MSRGADAPRNGLRDDPGVKDFSASPEWSRIFSQAREGMHMLCDIPRLLDVSAFRALLPHATASFDRETDPEVTES
jgi:hypothetical protein